MQPERHDEVACQCEATGNHQHLMSTTYHTLKRTHLHRREQKHKEIPISALGHLHKFVTYNYADMQT